MLLKYNTVTRTPHTYTGSSSHFLTLWDKKLYNHRQKDLDQARIDTQQHIPTPISISVPTEMQDGRSAWQGRYQTLPQNEPLLPQSLGRRDSARLDRRDSSANQRGERRSRSAQQPRPAAMQPKNMKLPAMLPVQKPVQLRQKDKLVLLPRTQSEQGAADNSSMETAAERALSASEAEMSAAQPSSSIFLDIPGYDIPDSRGRVTVYCISEALKLTELEPLIAAKYPDASINPYSEVLHVSLPPSAQQSSASGANQQPQQHQQQQQHTEPADCFFFEYGVCCFWGLSAKFEQEILKTLAKKAQQEPLPTREVEIDQFEYNYSTAAPPSMQNDTITISRHHANDHQVKLAICHALAQSTKLCVYEERVLELVLETKHLPQALATHGAVHITSQEIAQRIGQVFLQRSAVNLLSSVLDTPEFFWSAPDQLQVLYERACDYLELETRVEVLNARFQVLQEMLDMLRDHQQNHHSVRLEWIIIWLIAVELVVGLFELMGLFGLVGREH